MADRWDRRSTAEQGRRQRHLLATWLADATMYAPHWAEAASRAGMAPGEATTPGDLRRIHPQIQGDLVGNGGSALVQRPTESQLSEAARRTVIERLTLTGADLRRRRRRLHLEEFKPIHVTRGGVGGELVIASSKADIQRAMTAGRRAAAVLGMTDHDYLVSAVPAGPTDDYWKVQAIALGAQMLALHPRGHRDDLDRCVDAFGLVPATAVACHPGEAIAWARALARADADVSRVVFVLLVGPPGSEEDRAAIEDAWRAAGALERELVVRHVWSPDVHRSVWAECQEGLHGLHTQPELDLLEVVDPETGHPTAGRGGDLTVTTLGWRGTTFVRFRTGDAVVGIETVPCPGCRRTVPRVVGDVREAAWHLRLERTDGVAWFDTRAVDDAVAALSGIDEWRVVVRRDGADARYDVEVAGIEGVAVRLADRIGELTGVRAAGAKMVQDRGELAATVADRGHIVDER